MNIHTMNGKQDHYEQVKKDVIRYGEVTLKGWKIRDTIQLLEGSNRMIAAIELGVPITIVLVGDNTVVEHDDDETYSNTTRSWETATALELAASLAYSQRRSDYAVYRAEDYANITIIDHSK